MTYTTKPSDIYITKNAEERLAEVLATYRVIDFRPVVDEDLFINTDFKIERYTHPREYKTGFIRFVVEKRVNKKSAREVWE